MAWRALGWLVGGAMLAITLGCPPVENGEDPPTLEELFPADNEVGSWVEDTGTGEAGPDIANNYAEAEYLVDGDAEYFADTLVAFGREYYTDGTRSLQLRIWQLQDAASCATVYDGLVVDDPLYSSNSWTDVDLGEGGRVSDSGSNWWHNCHKDAFHIEAQTTPNDAAAATAAETLLEAVLAKIP